MRVYAITNGRTRKEEENVAVSRSYDCLTDIGKEQAVETGQQLNIVKFSAVYISPSQSAVETYEMFRKGYENDVSVIADSRLKEQDFGFMNGLKWSGDECRLYRESLFRRFPHGESFLDVVGRVYPFLDEATAEYPDSKDNILIISHNSPNLAIRTYFRDMTEEEFRAAVTEGFRLSIYEK